jgi:hypothetical protein
VERIAAIGGSGRVADDEADEVGIYLLNGATVFDATAADVLTGNGGRNWFFAGPGDRITDRKANEIVS